MTGAHLEGAPLTIEERPEALAALCAEVAGTSTSPKSSSTSDKFTRLWKGEWQGLYPSQSEADLALCGILAKRLGGDRAKVDQEFRRSGLFRPKWDERHYADGRTYGQGIIDKACSTTSETPKAQSGEDFFVKGKQGTLRFVPSRMGKYLTTVDHYMCLDGELYRYQDGVYNSGGESYLAKKVLGLLGDLWLETHWNQVFTWVTQRTHMKRIQLPENRGLVNVENGMVEIESGKLLPHSPDFRSIVQLPVKYDSGASSPELDSFVESIVPQDCIDLIWEFLGYCLMPWRELKRILYLVGPPDAGKSTLLTVVFRGLFGEELVAYQTMHDLASKRFAAAELFGKLVNVAADLDDTPITSVGILKQVTGGDPISAERKYGQPFSFVNVARLIFAANSLPHYRSELGVVAERIIPVPCENVFVSGVDLDRDIAMNLSCGSVRSALLNRALQGAQRLMQRGCFHEPESVKAMRPTHLNTSDTLALFIRDYVDRHEK